MGLIIPSRRDIVAAIQSYVRTDLPEIDPSTQRRSFIGGLVKSLGSALHDYHVALKRYGDNEPFPQTASRPFLLGGWWNAITRLNPLDAAPARGKVVMTGVAGTIVDAGLSLSANNIDYSVDVSTAVVAQDIAAANLSRSGTTAIFETAIPHDLATGMSLDISGAAQSDYNRSAVITVTAANEFTYDLDGATPATPATGTPRAAGAWAVAHLTARTTGQAANIDAGGTLTVNDGPDGLDAVALVTFGGLAGGSEVESTEAFRARTLEALGTDFGMFTAGEIKIVAKTVPGVTKVWVREATLDAVNGVAEGQVKIAFIRGGDANPFPSTQEVEDVKAVIVSTIMPAHTAPEDIMVMSPTPLTVNFSFASITPDTASMRRAIVAQLRQYFAESVDYATGISVDDYRCAIRDTYDRDGRANLKSFVLSSPTIEIAVEANELPVLGAVTFA